METLVTQRWHYGPPIAHILWTPASYKIYHVTLASSWSYLLSGFGKINIYVDIFTFRTYFIR